MDAMLDIGILKVHVGDDPALPRDLLAHFLSTARSQATALRAASAAGDAREASAIAHKLKSSSRRVGALVLGDLCAEIEHRGCAGDRDAVARCIFSFNAELAQVEAEIVRLLSTEVM